MSIRTTIFLSLVLAACAPVEDPALDPGPSATPDAAPVASESAPQPDQDALSDEQALKLELTELAAGDRRSAGGPCDADLCVDDLGWLDVYVSEVMPDPTACTDANGEWIEVYNATGGTVDLNGAILVDRSTGSRATVRDLAVLEPGAYAVIGRGSADAFCGPELDGTFGTAVTLNNDGDGLELLRPSDDLRIDWVLSWPAATPGVSFETTSEDWWAWLPAVDEMGAGELGTPGAGPHDEGYVRPIAQVPTGRLRISEIMGNPLCSYDGCEWVEIRNDGWVPVELDGAVLVDAGGHEGWLDAVVIAPYEALVFGRYDVGSWSAPHVAPAGYYGTLGLNNDGEQLALVEGDRVLWETPWFATFPSGVSLEHTSFGEYEAATTAIGDSGELGTPGY